MQKSLSFFNPRISPYTKIHKNAARFIQGTGGAENSCASSLIIFLGPGDYLTQYKKMLKKWPLMKRKPGLRTLR